MLARNCHQTRKRAAFFKKFDFPPPGDTDPRYAPVNTTRAAMLYWPVAKTCVTPAMTTKLYEGLCSWTHCSKLRRECCYLPINCLIFSFLNSDGTFSVAGYSTETPRVSLIFPNLASTRDGSLPFFRKKMVVQQATSRERRFGKQSVHAEESPGDDRHA